MCCCVNYTSLSPCTLKCNNHPEMVEINSLTLVTSFESFFYQKWQNINNEYGIVTKFEQWPDIFGWY